MFGQQELEEDKFCSVEDVSEVPHEDSCIKMDLWQPEMFGNQNRGQARDMDFRNIYVERITV